MAAKKKPMSKALQQKQELAEALLIKKGIDPQKWLEENYEAVIYDSIDTITKSIKFNEESSRINNKIGDTV